MKKLDIIIFLLLLLINYIVPFHSCTRHFTVCYKFTAKRHVKVARMFQKICSLVCSSEWDLPL